MFNVQCVSDLMPARKAGCFLTCSRYFLFVVSKLRLKRGMLDAVTGVSQAQGSREFKSKNRKKKVFLAVLLSPPPVLKCPSLKIQMILMYPDRIKITCSKSS